MIIIDPNLALSVAEKALELAIKIHDDIPPELRRQHWEKHFKTLEWVDKMLGDLFNNLILKLPDNNDK